MNSGRVSDAIFDMLERLKGRARVDAKARPRRCQSSACFYSRWPSQRSSARGSCGRTVGIPVSWARRSPGCQLRLPLRLPDPKTSGVELQRSFAAGQGDPLDDEFVLRDDALAGAAGFTVARPAPNPRGAIQRQATIGELAEDEET